MVKLRHQTLGNGQIRPIERAVECLKSAAPVDYDTATAKMEQRVAEIAQKTAPEMIWLLEHPPLYTAGTSANFADLLAPDRFPVHKTGRGGQFTYHGPGQRIAYVMLDLKLRTPDVRKFVAQLEEVLIRTLAVFDVTGERREDRVGVWVRRPDKAEGAEDKIAALGIRLRKWVTFHGLSLNVNPDLEHFSGIVPCGVANHGVTSLKDLGMDVGISEVDAVLLGEFENVFGAKLIDPPVS